MISAEARYRTLVRILPAWYRAERGDEMVGTLLDLHGERARAALWSELWALLALGARTRLAARAAPGRAVALGDLVRQVALLGLLWGVLRSAGSVGDILWSLLAFSDQGFFYRAALTSDLARDLVLLAAALIPLVLLVDGWRRLARIAAGAVLAAGAILFLTKHWSDLGPGPVVYFAPQWLPLVLVLAAFHVDAPLPLARPWWWAIGASLVLAPALAIAHIQTSALDRITGLSPLVWLCAIAGAGYLLLRRRTGPRPARTLALALCIALAVIQNLVLKNGIMPFGVVVIAQVCCVGAIVVALTVVGIRDYRRTVVRHD
ncbi:hypothetical protein JOF56_008557 [Kibdelosporangium banguiense]|uniref:Uncharacterized protein n=1 Tax=Kibdelosporangium banguiense TaxID=1365924 RepID=A0ABS4TUV7_9PSEU|nr:hypothetical protein [Kibdelosporangium banguiense]MBP2328172.1 hypothetical protein [Kibdelosporangium banguiense]